MTADPLAQLRAEVGGVAAAAGDGGAAPKLERPRQADLGDYSTNAAMLLAPVLGDNPRAIAERLGKTLGERLGAGVERVEVAGPGFLNLFMSDAWYLGALAGLLQAGESFGAGTAEPRRARERGVRERQPHGTDHGRVRPARRVRRRALPDPRVRGPSRGARVLRERRRRPDPAVRAVDPGPRPR